MNIENAKCGDILAAETVRSIYGVEGRAFNVIADGAGGIANQTWAASRDDGHNRLTVTLRFDDECRNGHATFSATATLYGPADARGRRRDIAGGCIHDDIARVFPELSHLLPFHLCSTHGPLHYVANTVYLAGDRDCHGLRAGQQRQMVTAKGAPMWRLAAVNYPGVMATTKNPEPVDGATDYLHVYSLETLFCGTAAQLPIAPRLEWLPCVRIGEGKARDLEAARRAAIWPDATDDELSVESEALTAALRARLPLLMAKFRALMVNCGFIHPDLFNGRI